MDDTQIERRICCVWIGDRSRESVIRRGQESARVINKLGMAGIEGWIDGVRKERG